MDLGTGLRNVALGALALSSFLAGSNATAQAPAAGAKKPNILVIFGDDIGYWNVNAYNQGMMHYSTPNIDRIAHEGALFTDYYAQQSCTAGRAAFITGQSPDPHRPYQGWPAGLAPRTAQRRSDACRAA